MYPKPDIPVPLYHRAPLKTHQWVTLLRWVTCSSITVNTLIYFDSIPHHSPAAGEPPMGILKSLHQMMMLMVMMMMMMELPAGQRFRAPRCRRWGSCRCLRTRSSLRGSSWRWFRWRAASWRTRWTQWCSALMVASAGERCGRCRCRRNSHLRRNEGKDSQIKSHILTSMYFPWKGFTYRFFQTELQFQNFEISQIQTNKQTNKQMVFPLI